MFTTRIVREQTGAATVTSVGFMAGLMSVVVVICLGIGALTQWLCAQAVTDFAALTAADAASGRIAGYPCELAAQQAEQEHYFLESCEVEDASARVTLGVTIAGIYVHFRAHAGPKNSEVNLTQ